MWYLNNSYTGSTLGSVGNEFFLGFPQGDIPSIVQLQLYISTTEPNPVNYTVHSANLTFTYTGRVTSNSVAIVDIPQEYQVETTELGITDQGIHMKAETDKKISVYMALQHGEVQQIHTLPSHVLE